MVRLRQPTKLRIKRRGPAISPAQFLAHMKWLDGQPLLKAVPPFVAKVLTDGLYTFGADGLPLYSLVLYGAGKKNFKTLCLILAALYRFLVWRSMQGNDCILLANDEGQAADDLELAKKLIAANPLLGREVRVLQKEIVRQDGNGTLLILPAKDIAGMHGKTWLFRGLDEIHAYRNYDVLEASAPDPTRPDALTWISSYASIYNTPGAPLFDLIQAGKKGNDPRMLFRWYAADYTTDPDLAGDEVSSERRANPAMEFWTSADYLEQERRRLPTHRFRRLHLNLPGMPDGAYFDAERVLAAIVQGRRQLPPLPDRRYSAFVDMSGGSSDDATLAIAHHDSTTNKAVLDLLIAQSGAPPFNPRQAVRRFVGALAQYRVFSVCGDRFAGETFRADFQEYGVSYVLSPLTKHELYESFEPLLNAGDVELLDVPKLQEQILGMVIRGQRIDHLPGEHDDYVNACAGAIHAVRSGSMSADDWAKGAMAVSNAESRELRNEHLSELGLLDLDGDTSRDDNPFFTDKEF